MDALQTDVLRAIADDYEEIESIVSDLRTWYPDRQFQKVDLAIALQQLIETGMASAYELSAKTGAATVVRFDHARLNELYFYASEEGKKKVIG